MQYKKTNVKSSDTKIKKLRYASTRIALRINKIVFDGNNPQKLLSIISSIAKTHNIFGTYMPIIFKLSASKYFQSFNLETLLVPL